MKMRELYQWHTYVHKSEERVDCRVATAELKSRKLTETRGWRCGEAEEKMSENEEEKMDKQ
jgi:hypothetical protein